MSLPPRPDVLADPLRRVEGLIVDSLPYVDDELDAPGMRDAVNALIIEEMGRYQPPEDGYTGEMRPLPDIAGKTSSHSQAVQAELARLAVDPTSVTQPRIGGPGFAAFPPAPTGAAASDPAAWRHAISRAGVALEEQQLRAINIELAGRYGVEAWRQHADEVAALAAAARARVASIAAQVDAVNAARQAAQVGPSGAGPRIKTLARRWAETAAANASAELAVADATREAKRLRSLAWQHGLMGDEAADGQQQGNDSTSSSSSSNGSSGPVR